VFEFYVISGVFPCYVGTLLFIFCSVFDDLNPLSAQVRNRKSACKLIVD